ncbi:MAG: aminoacyl-tRNA hydrolase [Bdellovibrionaceae bacterium]|nr:aminoacyl-tRNA hydrolase [Pseudobdellovibrionaceae bacterium]MBX3033956.1 aminoacyl-tRNA hydrolase [Pseudobdellovibrionaceae bacterium]
MSRYPGPDEVWFEAVRSRGPGGQNVNRTNSAAILRWHVPSTKLPEHVKNRLLEKLANKLTVDGELVIRSEETRDLEMNKKNGWKKLRDLIDAALFVPKKRIKTKPGKSAVRKRLDSKRKQGDKKRQRTSSWED